MKFFIFLFLPLFLFSHSLSVTASYESSELFIESYFGDGNACKACPFTVTNNKDEVYSGKLDETGVFEETVKLKTPFSVHIDGGMGHWADVKIEGNELLQPVEDNKTKKVNVSSNSGSGISEEQLKKIIRSELKKQNAKIEVMIEKNRSKLEKMLVGLGYILGIFGIWQLFVRRIKK